MPERHVTQRDGRRPGSGRPAGWAGAAVLAVCAGTTVASAGPVAVAVAAARPAPRPVLPADCRELCVSVQAAGTAAPGQVVSFGVRISPVSLLDNVTVRISAASAQPPAFPAATFTSCPSGGGTGTCTVGVLQAGQATELQAQVIVPGSAPGGDTATLSATATAAILGIIRTASATGSATVSVVRSQPSPPPSPHPSPPPSRSPSPPPSSPSTGGGQPGPRSGGGRHPSPGGSGGRLPAPGPDGFVLGTSPGQLALGLAPPPRNGLAGIGAYPNPGGLFPLVSPLPAAPDPGPSGRPKAAATHLRYHTTTVADVLPLSLRQVGYQIAALIALAIGVALAVVRIPLRKRRAP
jgi:hypothetical protein